jgi:hypothetical protein
MPRDYWIEFDSVGRTIGLKSLLNFQHKGHNSQVICGFARRLQPGWPNFTQFGSAHLFVRNCNISVPIMMFSILRVVQYLREKISEGNNTVNLVILVSRN